MRLSLDPGRVETCPEPWVETCLQPAEQHLQLHPTVARPAVPTPEPHPADIPAALREGQHRPATETSRLHRPTVDEPRHFRRSSWCIFGCTVRTNNDVEGKHKIILCFINCSPLNQFPSIVKVFYMNMFNKGINVLHV